MLIFDAALLVAALTVVGSALWAKHQETRSDQNIIDKDLWTR